MRLRLFLPPVVALTLFAQTPAPEQPVKNPNTRLVEVNVVVRDKNGPVPNLTAKDFTLLDKGKEQKIASFVASNNRVAPSQKLPANVFSNRPSQGAPPTGITVILMDALNTPVQVQSFARAEFLKIISEIKPADHVVVYVLGSRLHVMSDIAGRGGEDSSLEDWLVESSVAGGLNIVNQLHTTTDALVTIAAQMRPFVGRKNLVWVAGAYPVSVDHFGAEGPPGWEAGATNISAAATSMNAAQADPTQVDRQVFQKTFSAAMQALNFAGISVYEVDARGLVDMPTSQTVAGTGSSRSRGSAMRGSEITLVPRGTGALRTLVEDSGGRIWESSNDIRQAIRTAISDAEATYTLGYYPDAKSLDMRYHDLKVQVSRKDVDLHYRKGYVALAEPKTSDAVRTEGIRYALASPLEADGIGLMAAYEKSDQPKAGSLRATVVISGSDLSLQQNGDQWTGELELILSPRGADGKDKGTTRQALGLKLAREQYETVMKQGVSLTKTLEQAGDITELRAVVCDHVSGRLGSLIMPVK
jgi:VWFA-related protein